MKVGFLNNQIDNRGTGNALFDYAHYNEEILGNESYIFTLDQSERNPLMVKRLQERFYAVYTFQHLVDYWREHQLDVLYHIKADRQYEITIPNCKYVVHAVFDAKYEARRDPLFQHSGVVAAVSEWMGKRDSVPWVPHIVEHPFGWGRMGNLRKQLGIPDTALVFGRHGGADSFDVPWVWNAIQTAHNSRSDVFFIFMGTDIPLEFRGLERVLSVPPTADPVEKIRFISTCDAMLHARMRGETFGIAVAEFAAAFRPVITYDGSPERAHLEMLGPSAIRYSSLESLLEILLGWEPKHVFAGFGTLDRQVTGKNFSTPIKALKFTPNEVMQKFKEVFLD